MTLFVSIVGLLFLILIHEAGHFFTALAVGIRPRKFYIGFPPAIAKMNRNGIEYGVGAIPLGGYVRIPGMHRPAAKDVQINFAPALREAPELQAPLAAVERDLAAGDFEAARAGLPALIDALDRAELSHGARKSAERGLRDLDESLGTDAYWRQRTWKKVAVIFAGPGVNILFAIVLLAAVYMLGVPDANTRTVQAVEAGKPAAVIGLRSGDEILAVNGKPTPTFESIRARIQASHGRPITLAVERNGETVKLGPAKTIRSGDRWILGFVPGVAYKHYGAPTAFRYAVNDCWQAIKGMGLAIKGLFYKEGRHRPRLERRAQGQLPALSADSRPDQPLPGAAQPASAPTARRGAHPLLDHRGRAAAGGRARGLRAGLGDRLLRDPADLLHRALERPRRPRGRLDSPRWLRSARSGSAASRSAAARPSSSSR
jgi:membrane-associated protease RseP (regulator of RpoE activity)